MKALTKTDFNFPGQKSVFHTADFADAAFVSTPCATAQIAAYNHFYRKAFAQNSEIPGTDRHPDNESGNGTARRRYL